jgi:hypothetical protein
MVSAKVKKIYYPIELLIENGKFISEEFGSG